jgi:hypothetical protein
MTEPIASKDAERARIMLGLLESVEQGGAQSQRRLSAELGIALGLVNAYLRRSVKKGLLKIRKAPARRYAYYLTPRGFAEKSRLTVEYLTYSLSFFRLAKTDCTLVFEAARARGFERVAIAGVSDLGEIAAICALESGIEITFAVDPRSTVDRFVGVPVVSSFNLAREGCDAVIVTDLQAPLNTMEAAIEQFGADRVLVPRILGQGLRKRVEAEV